MPYPTEHSARLQDPKALKARALRVRRTKGSGKATVQGAKVPATIGVIWYILKATATKASHPVAQALRFPVKAWGKSPAKAKAWLKTHKIKPIRFEAAGPLSKAQAAADTAQAILAAGGEIELLAEPDAVEIVAATTPDAADDGGSTTDAQDDASRKAKPKLPTFKATAYTGVPMFALALSAYPVVVDLAGLRVSKAPRPVLLEHDHRAVVGHTSSIAVSGTARPRLLAAGVVSGAGPAAAEVLGAAANGFPWRISIGAKASQIDFVDKGQTATVNGRKVAGPVYITKRATLGEISFVALAADDATSARVAATRNLAAGQHGETTMDPKFTAWLEAKGFDPEALTDQQVEGLQASFDAETAEPKPKPKKKKAAPATGRVPVKADDDGEQDVPVQDAAAIEAAKEAARLAAKETLALERQRVADIEAACRGFDGDEKVAELKASAIAGDIEPAELLAKLVEHIRAARPGAPAIQIAPAGEAVQGQVIEAALHLAVGLPEPEKAYDEKTVEAAYRHYREAIGLQELLLTAAAANGYTGRWAISAGNLRQVLRSAFAADIQGAGFSTIDLSGILGATANKSILAAFNAVEQTWQAVSAIGSVKDFKTVTRYRMTGAMQYEQVGPDGELHHGELGEESYTNKADTYGKMFALTRHDIINDDLGAFRDVPARIGRGAALKINDVFWTEFVDNAAFYTALLGNYGDGAGSALGIDSLTTAEAAFLTQTDADDKPLAIEPRILLVPPALYVTGTQLYKSLELRNTTATTKYPTSNPHAGKFRVEKSAYLQSAAYGNSAVAWYLLADPADLAVIETVFLNGKREPTVESAEADFNVLGVQFRGFHDFGVNKQEYRAGYKSKGSA